MHYFLGALALLGVGFIGFLIETNKQLQNDLEDYAEANHRQARYHEELEHQIEALENNKRIQDAEMLRLYHNQKPIPWNKGKKGYKLTRKPKVQKVEVQPDGSLEMTDNTAINEAIKLFTPRLD